MICETGNVVDVIESVNGDLLFAVERWAVERWDGDNSQYYDRRYLSYEIKRLDLETSFVITELETEIFIHHLSGDDYDRTSTVDIDLIETEKGNYYILINQSFLASYLHDYKSVLKYTSNEEFGYRDEWENKSEIFLDSPYYINYGYSDLWELTDGFIVVNYVREGEIITKLELIMIIIEIFL